MTEQNEIRAALPDYAVEGEIGHGGMGVVFLGRHTRLGRMVAIKELPPSFSSDPEVRERFSTEARTLASLSHPHIVPIYDYVERDGLCLIVMEQLPGGTVWDRFTSAGLTPPAACAIALACCAALQHAHDKGVLHLDVKPDNLMFAVDAAVRVTDFGISRVLGGDETLGTADGQVLGTPAYMSPEQARGSELTSASDVYSTGVMLYELLSGHLPWVGAETATELLLKRLREDPRPLRSIAPQVPEALADVVMKAIEREREDRFSSAEEFGIAIASACADSWGPNWLDLAGVVITGSDKLSLAARTTRGQTAAAAVPHSTTAAPAAAAAATSHTSAVGDEQVAGASQTTATPAAGSRDSDPAANAVTPVSAPEAAVPPVFEVVRAAGSAPRIGGADLNAIDRNALINVAQIMVKSPSARRALALAALLAIAALVAGTLMFAPAKRSGGLKPRDVVIAGVPLGSKPVPLDLSSNLAVRVRNAGFASLADRVTLRMTLADVKMSELSAPLLKGAGEFDTKIARHVAAGSLTGRVDLYAKTTRIGYVEFPMHATQPWYATAEGIGAILLVLGALAYLEAALRPLRAGRRRLWGFIGAAISGAVAAVGIAGIAAALGHADPNPGGLVVVAATAGLSAWVLAVAALRRGRRRSLRHAVRRHALKAPQDTAQGLDYAS
ncbi:MAG TPA: serine/threonine-protein kinase [Acidimicrobiia bacterium]|nr:serine/threonine-protein kinase [Acidimicrobiia bacterium]